MFDALFDWFKELYLEIWLFFVGFIEGSDSDSVIVQIPNMISELPLFVLYVLSNIGINECFSAIISAYLIRFIIRRIPFIG